MDANQLRFWMFANENHWNWASSKDVEYDADCCCLRLKSQRLSELNKAQDSPATLREVARSQLNQVPQTCDRYGTHAYWVPPYVMATGALPTTVPIFNSAPGEEPTDLAMGYDDVLYMAIAGKVILKDCRDRWEPVTLTVPGFKAWRLAASPEGGVWVWDKDHRQLGRVQGLPLPPQSYAADQFQPCKPNAEGSHLTIWQEAQIPPEEEVVAIACSPTGHLAILTWLDSHARVRCLNQLNQWTPPINLADAEYAYSLAWVTDDRIAVIAPNIKNEALVYLIEQSIPSPSSDLDLIPYRLSQSTLFVSKNAQTIDPVGDYYPLRQYKGGSFVHGLTIPPHYLTEDGTAPLYHLALTTYASEGKVSGKPTLDQNSIDQPPAIDSQNAQTIWHRLYLEAVIPPNCGIQVYLAATDHLEEADFWYLHHFGDGLAASDRNTPRGAWVPQPSEIPYHPGLLNCEREKNHAGLFNVLIQRSDRKVRSLQGRYLWIKLKLLGDGRTTPQVFALRVYASRFSYVQHYLPELYHETTLGSDRDEISNSTASDFLERFLCNFEGILTTLEDRIASSYLMTDPRMVPEGSLEWLGSWLGVAYDPLYPSDRRRRHLEATSELYRCRGTLTGLKLALDIATGGGVTGGEIVVVEDFRLRRTFATILGADLADEVDPLLCGLVESGNSYVGDTLLLGEETRQEFLALFRADIQDRVLLDEQQSIDEFLHQLAHRVTIFIHEDLATQDWKLIQRVVELEAPAHVATQIVKASYPLIVSLSTLLGVDTYLSPERSSQPIRLGDERTVEDRGSAVGDRYDRIQRPASLDPRLEGGTASILLS